jgi:hypothetical protein
MATVTDTDIQQLKDLITAGQIATQRQIAELSASTQKQITDGNATIQKQITDGNATIQRQITDGNVTIQRQITDGNDAVQKQIAGVEVGLGKLEAEIKGIHTELTDIKVNQRAQDTRFFSLIFLILTTAIGISAKLAKLY